ERCSQKFTGATTRIQNAKWLRAFGLREQRLDRQFDDLPRDLRRRVIDTLRSTSCFGELRLKGRTRKSSNSACHARRMLVPSLPRHNGNRMGSTRHAKRADVWTRQRSETLRPLAI